MLTFQKLVIYYFSGTGNSRNVASWISALASRKAIESHVVNIADVDRLTIEKPPKEALVIFISPVHGFNYPPVMLNFIMRFPKGRNKVLLMNTRAGMLIRHFVTPGLSGITFYLSGLVLRLKGYSIQGIVPVDLPSNWVSLHPGLNERTIKYLHERNKERVTLTVEKIILGGKNFRALREIIQDAIVSPISFLYYFIGRFGLSKSFYASADCNNCDICISNCPVKAIIKIDNRPFWTFKCESCMRCMGNCPKKAIETAHGLFLGVIFLNSAILGLFYKFFNFSFFKIENRLVRIIVDNSVFLILLGISYFAFHFLMRFKPFAKFIVYTSLTKYKFWGKPYKALKN